MMASDFQDFQREFARHLRDPHHVARPAGIPARRAALYGELVFNNLCGFLDACFPVCRSLLGEKRWRRLNRTFQRDWPLHTPWFREIPQEFVRYLEAGEIRQLLPRWLAELAHYEWVELAVDTRETPEIKRLPGGDLLDGKMLLNPSLQCLIYQWPVQHISPDWRPRQPRETHLAVYRDQHQKVRFSELTPLTTRLLDLLGHDGMSGRQAILQIASEINHPEPARLLEFGSVLLADMQAQEIILGCQP